MIMNDVELIQNSGLFDVSFYEEASLMSFANADDAIVHYLETGWRKNLDPSGEFDTGFYLLEYPDVKLADMNPLLHYVKHGKVEKRRARLSKAPKALKPRAPSNAYWDQARWTDSGDDARLSVIVPVYRGYHDTLACLQSVLDSTNETKFNLIVIDDCSPEIQLSKKLEEIADKGFIKLEKNIENLGFVGSVNKGIELAGRNDVILLNSDTIVYNNWIDRLKIHAYKSNNVATVTPLSNNATIFSYPYFNMSNNQLLEMGYRDFDKILSGLFKNGKVVEVPTGVGFCFYMTRSGIDKIGLFDMPLFGKGYGEENDYCFRAIEHGMINVAAPDIFVRHTGEVSFSSDSNSGKSVGGSRLSLVHPRYDDVIREHMTYDPLQAFREAIDIERFATASCGRGILFVEHLWGGGIERHINDLEELLHGEGIPTLTLRPTRDNTGLEIISRNQYDYPNFAKISWDDFDKLSSILRRLNISKVHIHSLVGLSFMHIEALIQAIMTANLKYVFTMHDYVPICPRLTMMDWSDTYCDSPNDQYCSTCIDKAGSPFGRVDIVRWRSQYGNVMRNASEVIAPSVDVHDRIIKYVPGLDEQKVSVRYHPYTDDFSPTPAVPPSDDKLVVGIVGAIGKHKGSRIIHMLANDAIDRNLNIRFNIYGYTNYNKLEDHPNIFITGSYKESELYSVLDKNPCHILLYLSVCPETFCYTLDVAFRRGLYPVCFELGAVAERIKSTGFGTVLPGSFLYDACKMNDKLLEIHNSGTEIKFPFEPKRVWKGAENYYSI